MVGLEIWSYFILLSIKGDLLVQVIGTCRTLIWKSRKVIFEFSVSTSLSRLKRDLKFSNVWSYLSPSVSLLSLLYKNQLLIFAYLHVKFVVQIVQIDPILFSRKLNNCNVSWTFVGTISIIFLSTRDNQIFVVPLHIWSC